MAINKETIREMEMVQGAMKMNSTKFSGNVK